MISWTENSTQTVGSSSGISELKHRQKPGLENGFFANEVTHQPVNEQNKLATEPVLLQIENLCALLARQNAEWAGNQWKSKATGLRRLARPQAQRTTDMTVGFSDLVFGIFRPKTSFH